MIISVKSKSEDNGKRLDVFLAESTEYTRSYLKKISDDGKVFVDGKLVRSNYVIKREIEITIEVPDPVKTLTEAENIPLDIIYQDEDIVVVNKAQGMTVHAGNGNRNKTLVNALLYHVDKLSGINGVIRPGIVHRIDKNTSGLLVVAKNDKAHVSLAKQIENKTCSENTSPCLKGS